MKGLCAKCEERDTCVELCKKAEDYVNQDFVTVDEGLIYKNIENKEKVVDYDSVEDTPLSFLKARYRTAIINLYKDGKPTKEIAYHVPFSKRHIRRIIEEYKSRADII